MKSLITVLLLGLFISSQAQNISQSQVRQFNAVPAYRVFGRGAGVGTPSFITLDSNHVPQLHSQGYYDLRYGSLAAQNGKLNSNFGIQGSVLFRGTTGVSESNPNFVMDSAKSILQVISRTTPSISKVLSSITGTQGMVFSNSNYLQKDNFIVPTQVIWLGDSYTSGFRPNSPDTTFVTRLSGDYGLSSTNYGLSGSGIWSSTRYANLNINPTYTGLTSVMAGFNDLRRSSSSAIKKIINGFNAIISNQFLKSFVNAGVTGAGVSRTGTWATNYTSGTLGGKSASNGAFTSVLNDYITYTFIDSTVVVGLFGTDGSAPAYTNANFDVYIDNVLIGHYTENLQTDGVSDGVYDNKRIPYTMVFNGLSNATHTIKLQNTSASGAAYLVVDYFGTLKDATDCSPILVWHIPYNNVAGYATSPSLGNVAATVLANNQIDALIASWKQSYPIYTVPTENFYDTLSCLATDNIHPNNYGDSMLTKAALSVMPNVAGNYFGTSIVAGTKRPVAISNGVRKEIALLEDIKNAGYSSSSTSSSLPATGLTAPRVPYTSVTGTSFADDANFAYSSNILKLNTPAASGLVQPLYLTGNPGSGINNGVGFDIRNTNATSNKTQLNLGGGTAGGTFNRTLSIGTDLNGDGSLNFFVFNTSNGKTPMIIDGPTGNVGLLNITSGVSALPTAILDIRASTGAAGTAPIKLRTTSATLMTTPEAGAFETDGTDLYWTNSAGVRKKVTVQ